MKKTIHVLSSFVFFFCLSVAMQKSYSQTNIPVSIKTNTTSNETAQIQERAEATINQVDWANKMRNIDARKLENLEKWHQFPLGKMIKQTPTISSQDLTIALQAWYNEKPAERAKIIVAFE